MTILELVKQLDTIQKEYKRQVEDLPRNYVRGSQVFKEASERVKTNYEASKIAIKEQIKAKLEVIKSKAELEKEVEQTLNQATEEQLNEGYNVVNVIAKTVDSLTPYTLENLLLKIKDLDQLLVINDVVNKHGNGELINKVKKHAQLLDQCNQKCVNTMELVKEFEHALATSGDGMTFTMLSLATQLSETKEV